MISEVLIALSPLLLGVIGPIAVMAIFRVTVERVRPIEPARASHRGVNIAAFLVWFSTQAAFAPGMTLLGTWLTNRLGGGYIALPTDGWAMVGGFVAYFLFMDLVEYLFHRAEHVFPWFWSIHSLHHSDRAFDASTSALHHWLSPFIRSLAVGVPLGLMLKVPTLYLTLYSVICLYTYVYHANLRLQFGRFAWLLNSPSYHRLHHSAAAEHFNCNYAATLPLFDVLFGTYRAPARDEWPEVGISDGSQARDLFDLLFWPVRGSLRALVARPKAGAPQNT